MPTSPLPQHQESLSLSLRQQQRPYLFRPCNLPPLLLPLLLRHLEVPLEHPTLLLYLEQVLLLL